MANSYLDGAGDPLYGVNGTPADTEIPKYDVGDDRLEFAADDSGVGGGGALVFLEGHTASASSSLDFTSFISSTYDEYVIIGTEIVPATNATNLLLEVGTGGGPTYDTGNNYQWAHSGRTPANTDINSQATTGLAPVLYSISTGDASFQGSFQLTAHALRSTSVLKLFHGTGAYIHTTGPTLLFVRLGLTWITAGTAVSALRFIMSSGNITSGSIGLYGVAKT
jgi:hypothetical protein